MIETPDKPTQDPSTAAVTAVCSAMPITRDAAVLVGELFRRLALATETFPEGAFGRIVSAIHVALGRAVLEEAERRARMLRERAEPPRSSLRAKPGRRPVDFGGGWDIEGEK